MTINHDNHSETNGRFARTKFLLLSLLGGLTVTAANAAPLGTAFTYSGRLKYQGQPANGNFDLLVTNFDATVGGTAFGDSTLSGLYCANGLFVTNIDFGQNVFNGTAYWLEIWARPGGNGAYQKLSPRQPLTPAPYALFAPSAETANTASTAAANSVSGTSIQPNAITANKIASGQVVKSLNGLFDNVTLAPGANVSLTPNGNTLTIAAGGGGGSGWSLTGNAGTAAGQHFLGTTDNQPLALKSFGSLALRLEFAGREDAFSRETSINVLGGSSVNSISANVLGGTVAGGGGDITLGLTSSIFPNRVTGDYGTVGGGSGNTAGAHAAVPGGGGNHAGGRYSFAAGHNARTDMDGSFVWADSHSATFLSVRPNEFAIRSAGGLFLQSDAGIRLNAANTPIITRVWDPFAPGTGAKEAHGRWGLFMEPFNLVLGIPDTDVPGGERRCAIWKYRTDGSADELFHIKNTDSSAWFAGDVSVRTLTIRGGMDLAEPFSMSQPAIEKGSVVVIDEEHPGQLKLSLEPYDTRVAGIVSGADGINPGISLRQEGVNDGGQNVALSGRVYVLADAANGIIKPGDLLTTSPTPGHAMKATDHARAQGAILGKAMSGLKAGKGMVLVLVSLQ